jgi:hypothetical protein
MEHQFSQQIKTILRTHFEAVSEDIYDKSPLLQYLNIKTRSATRGSKARSSFANIYAIYVLVEDYVIHGFDEQNGYSKYEGAKFTHLLKRQRELPFGSKLQNHALNHRMNEEFRKYFPQDVVLSDRLLGSRANKQFKLTPRTRYLFRSLVAL